MFLDSENCYSGSGSVNEKIKHFFGVPIKIRKTIPKFFLKNQRKFKKRTWLNHNFLAFIVPKIVEFIQIGGHDNSTRLLILSKTINNLNVRKRDVLQVTYFSTKLVCSINHYY